jgi:Acetoacetate decarboxylase (ADC)
MPRFMRRTAAVATAAVALRVFRRGLDARGDRRFMAIDPGRDSLHEVGAIRFRLPAQWHRTDGFATYWLADLEAVQALLPSPLLYPVRVDRRHGLVGVSAFRHFESTARAPDGTTMLLPAYGEAGIFIAVTRRPMPPLAPLLLQRLFDAPVIGGYVLHLPVTARFHRDGGRTVWGLPKFLADMEFGDDGTSRSVHLSEGGRTIFDLRVEASGSAGLSRAPNLLYSVLDGRLLEIRLESRTFAQVGTGADAELTLGHHPASAELREVSLSKRPIVSSVIQQQRFVMPVGRDLGPARPRRWFEGRDAEFSRFVTRHADGTLVDHYASGAGVHSQQREREAAEAAIG